MLNPARPEARRAALREALGGGRALRVAGAFNPLVGRLAERHGFDAAYVSGGAFAASLGMPDIGLTTLSEVVAATAALVDACGLPVIVDADTGFGEPMNAARTVRALEAAGAAGLHIEDQINPKRCGHLDNKGLVDTDTMRRRLIAAVGARRDANLLIIARTDARAAEGLEAAAERARAYLAAGAEMIFAEALETAEEFRAFKRAIGGAPLLANMTEFGKSALLDYDELQAAGADVVLYPVTSLRLAMKAVDEGFAAMMREGHQRGLLDAMQTRAELYDLLEYSRYAAFDDAVYNFTLGGRNQ